MAGNVTTLPITLDQMIYHAKSVVRGVKRAMVVVDMPFGSYQGNETGLRLPTAGIQVFRHPLPYSFQDRNREASSFYLISLPLKSTVIVFP